MKLSELLKVYLGLYKIKINTGCDYICFESGNYDPSLGYGDCTIHEIMTSDNSELIIYCNLGGENDD